MSMQAEPDFFINSYFFLTLNFFPQRYLSKHEEAIASSCLNVYSYGPVLVSNWVEEKWNV